ncbi:unnamed protein product [Adineta steineri]|uniref:Uncharacterized protein n=1 Tax=Adineta steineri TaxID=433720 RepID=A0A819BX61_9BILA|nr:unnamed protein product [Adineta steineri]
MWNGIRCKGHVYYGDSTPCRPTLTYTSSGANHGNCIPKLTYNTSCKTESDCQDWLDLICGDIRGRHCICPRNMVWNNPTPNTCACSRGTVWSSGSSKCK